jgi:hypothetical protein
MNKLNSPSTSVILSPSPASQLESASWLIVLVPSIEADLGAATQRVWELANAGSKRVRFIGLYENAAQELTLRRQLAGMSAMVGSTGIYTETEPVSGNDWIEVVRSRSQAGDIVACLANHRSGSLNRSVSNILQENINLPIYILSSSYIRKGANLNWKSLFFFWSFSIATLIGFFLLQARINRVTSGWFETTLMLTSATLTLFTLWVWNNLFS